MIMSSSRLAWALEDLVLPNFGLPHGRPHDGFNVAHQA
jgi:hypothetical protein